MKPVNALLAALQEDTLNSRPDLAKFSVEINRGPTRAALASLLENVVKKQRDTIDNDACERAAHTTFMEVNSRAGDWIPGAFNSEHEEVLWGTLKRVVYDFFYWDGDTPLIRSYYDLWANGSLGNGSCQKALSTDFYTKLFQGPLSVSTPSLYYIYRQLGRSAPNWHDAEVERRLANGSDHLVISKSGRFGFVPKNDRTARSIETQATLNMFFQRGLSALIEHRLKRWFGIDLSSQPDRNRMLARRGSRWGVISTIDLSSASDSISLRLFRELVPQSQQHYFTLTRHDSTEMPKKFGGETVTLNMLSTMGNGFTFSFQTMLFACMVKASYLVAGRRFRKATQAAWGVFGDDIAVPYGAVTSNVLTLLGFCGFRTNAEKTFIQGPFRESCGKDFVNGVNVRPVYIKSLKTLESCFVAYNNLALWSAEHEIPLPATLDFLRGRIRNLDHGKWRIVPASFGADCGVWSPYPEPGKLRYNRNGTPTVKCRLSVASRIWFREGTISYRQPRGSRKSLRTAPSGILLGILRGDIRGTTGGKMFVAERQLTPTYRDTVVAAPNWSPPPSLHLHRCRRYWVSIHRS